MKFLYVNTAEDLRCMTTRADAGTEMKEDVIVIFTRSHITIPFEYPGWFFVGLKNCYFIGATGPAGKVLIDGYPLIFTDCEDIHVSDIAMRLDRPAGRPFKEYEKWWNSPKVLTLNPAKPSRNIRFHRCSMSGNTDEIDCGPDNPSTWPGEATAIIGLEFYQCFFGPSFRGRLPGRDRHNFGVGATHVTDALFKECVFAGHNRRCPQIKGEAVIQDCLINGVGTMAIGVYGSSTLSVVNTIHVPDLMTATKWSADTATNPRRVPIVSVVPDTPWTADISLYVDGIHEQFTTRKHGAITLDAAQLHWAPRSNWDAVINCEPVTILEQSVPHKEIVGKTDPWEALTRAGVQDSMDIEVAAAVRSGSMPWIYDYGELGRFYSPVAEYSGAKFPETYPLNMPVEEILASLLELNKR